MKTFPTAQDESPANLAFSGGGGNRTRALFPTGYRPPVEDLDLVRLGQLLVRSVCASAFLRHKNVRSTARVYLHPDSPESEFVIAILKDTPTAELDERWFGGKAVAWAMEDLEIVSEAMSPDKAKVA